jgi:hypothetical protein
MAVYVIHLLELVQVDQQQGCVRLGPASALQGVVQSVLEESAIRKTGQLVVQGKILIVFNLLLKN